MDRYTNAKKLDRDMERRVFMREEESLYIMAQALQQEEVLQPEQPVHAEPSAPEKPAAKPAQPVKKRKTTLAGVVTALVLLIVVALGVYNVALSLVKYSAVRGLQGSAFVGMDNYEYVLGMPNVQSAFENSAAVGLLQLVMGLALALPLTLGVKLPKKPGKVLTLSCLCLLPVCLPVASSAQALRALLPRDMLMSTEAGPVIVALAGVLQTAGFIAFCGGLFAYLKCRGIGKGAFQGVGAGLLISLFFLLTNDLGAVMLMGNSINRATTGTLDHMVYSAGLVNAQVARAAAISVLQMGLQMMLAILPAIFLCRIAKLDTDRKALPDAKAAVFTMTGAKLVWIVALLAVTVFTFGKDLFMNNPEASVEAMIQVATEQSVGTGLLNAVVIAALGGLVACCAAYSFIRYFGQGGKGLGLAMVLMATSVSFTMGKYLMAREVGVLNTSWPVIFSQVFDPRLVGLMIILAIAMRMAPDRSHKGLFVALSLLAAAFAWGDFVSPHIYTYNISNQPMAALLYRAMNGVNLPTELGQMMTEELLLMQEALQPVYSLLTSLPALILGGLGATFLVRALKKAE